MLGTGTLGAPMTRRLVEAGHDVRAWNRTSARAEGLGAEVAATAADAVAGAEVVVTLLSDGPTIDEVMRPALPAMTGAVWLQMSTVGVEWTDRLVAAGAAHGVPLVDAPVMGSKPQAEQGTLLPLVSGPPAARELCGPLFDVFSERQVLLGDEAGTASRLKLALNLWTISTVAVLADVVVFCEGLGLDPHRFLDGISGMGFDMKYAHWKAQLMFEQRFDATFSIALARKDVRLALEAAQAVGVDLALAQVAEQRLGKAVELGHGGDDTAALYLASLSSRLDGADGRGAAPAGEG